MVGGRGLRLCFAHKILLFFMCFYRVKSMKYQEFFNTLPLYLKKLKERLCLFLKKQKVYRGIF